jgi:hypothetical protein
VAFALGLEELVQENGYVAVHCHPRERRILSLAPCCGNAFPLRSRHIGCYRTSTFR